MKAFRWILALVVVAAAGFGIFKLLTSSHFKLTTVEVVGVSKEVTAEEIVATTGLNRGKHLLAISGRDVEKKVREIAWVLDADAERILPSKIRITVEFRKPFFVTSAGGRSFLIDKEGIVLTEGTRPLVRLSGLAEADLVVGSQIKSESFKSALDVLSGLTTKIRGRVTSLNASGPRTASVTLTNGVKVIYGDGQRMKIKNLAAEALLDKHAGQGDIVESIDVRAPTRPAVKLRSSG